MKLINAIIGYFMFWFMPSVLMRKSLHGMLLQLNVRLPKEVSDQIANSLYLIFKKNKRDMETMWALIENEAFFIKDLLSPSYVRIIIDNHEHTIATLERYNIQMPNLR